MSGMKQTNTRMFRELRRKVLLIPAAGLVCLLTVQSAAAQTGVITGAVSDVASGQLLESALVRLDGAETGVLTTQAGRYLMPGVSAGSHQITVSILGYEETTVDVTVSAGETTVLDVELTVGALKLQELVVTGVARGTPRVKLPFTVDKVDVADIPVPPVSAAGFLIGKVPGVKVQSTSGTPGSTSDILLRAATSISGSDFPLIIVDNVITSSNLSDVVALDIESFEIVKGAAGASMYGSRAANGVIQIFTKRGTGFGGRDYNRLEYRNETGVDQQVGSIPLSQNHPWETDSEGYLVSVTGQRITDLADPDIENPALNTGSVNTSFQDGVWPSHMPLYDHIDRIFEDGWLLSNYGVLEGRDGGTNYRSSFEAHRDMGVFPQYFDGFGRKGFRLNLDNQVRDGLTVNLSTVYTQSSTDNQNISFYSLTFMGPYVDLLARDERTAGQEPCGPDGCYIYEPDALAQATNPLYNAELNRSNTYNEDVRAAVNTRWTPMSWLDVEAVFAMDRNSNHNEFHRPAGVPYNSDDGDQPSTGGMNKRQSHRESINGELTVSASRAFGDLNTRTRARYLQRSYDYDYFYASGSDFIAAEVPRLNNTDPDSHYVASSQTATREEGYFLIAGLDYQGKYIVDGVVRQDGSSLFGADQRWQTYYRSSLAWRPSLEDWWPVPDQINEFKLHWSRGTAGRRPGFSDQYETYFVSSGTIRPTRLGNKELRPQRSTEDEVGVNMVLFNRVTTSLVYSFKDDVDQILSVPLPRAGGYSSQVQNAGTLSSSTWEYSVEMPVLSTEDFGYNVRVNLDRSRSTITQLDRPAYRSGTFWYRDGEVYGAHYGVKWAKSCNDLPVGVDCGQFQLNDDGLMVWTGGAGYTDGVAQSLWGTDSDGQTGEDIFKWGLPIKSWGDNNPDDGVQCMERRQAAPGCKDFLYLGNTWPDLNFSMTHTFRWRGLSVYALLDGEMGVDIYNGTRQWAYRDNRSGDMDQAGKADGLKKPVVYYQLLYNTNADNDWFVEDTNFLKVRELSVRYALNPDWLDAIFGGRVTGADVNLIGRNLYTLTGYTGFDPEVGGIVRRNDNYNYPNPRRISFSLQLTF